MPKRSRGKSVMIAASLKGPGVRGRSGLGDGMDAWVQRWVLKKIKKNNDGRKVWGSEVWVQTFWEICFIYFR
jgi:hypothetical protein